MKALAKRPNFMTVPAAVRELEKIEMVRLTDNKYRLDHAVTATQKTILKAFGMDAGIRKVSCSGDQPYPERGEMRWHVEEKG